MAKRGGTVEEKNEGNLGKNKIKQNAFIAEATKSVISRILMT